MALMLTTVGFLQKAKCVSHVINSDPALCLSVLIHAQQVVRLRYLHSGSSDKAVHTTVMRVKSEKY